MTGIYTDITPSFMVVATPTAIIDDDVERFCTATKLQ